MASALSDSRCERPRGKNGQFVKGPYIPKEDSRGRGRNTDLALRKAAFRLIDHLENALPKLAEGAPSKKAGEAADETPVETADGSSPSENSEKSDEAKRPEKPKWTPADYDRLLGRHGGVVDGFRTLADLILRLTELEQKRRAHPQSSPDFTEDDEEDLDRRIADELDRLAEQRGPANAG